MIISQTKLAGVVLLTPPRYGDNRGFFSEIWNKQTLSKNGLDYDFVQDNHSLSAEIGTVRGLHCQAPPHAQDKLVRCSRGRLIDVAVDIRVGSPTFGRWVAQELSFENGIQLLVPAGFLHGFATLEPDTEIVYKCTNYYFPECELAVRFDDPNIGIDWQLPENSQAILSDKDSDAPHLHDFDSPFAYEG